MNPQQAVCYRLPVLQVFAGRYCRIDGALPSHCPIEDIWLSTYAEDSVSHERGDQIRGYLRHEEIGRVCP